MWSCVSRSLSGRQVQLDNHKLCRVFAASWLAIHRRQRWSPSETVLGIPTRRSGSRIDFRRGLGTAHLISAKVTPTSVIQSCHPFLSFHWLFSMSVYLQTWQSMWQTKHYLLIRHHLRFWPVVIGSCGQPIWSTYVPRAHKDHRCLTCPQSVSVCVCARTRPHTRRPLHPL